MAGNMVQDDLESEDSQNATLIKNRFKFKETPHLVIMPETAVEPPVNVGQYMFHGTLDYALGFTDEWLWGMLNR